MTTTTLSWSAAQALTPTNAQNAPERSGVYALSERSGVIYIGESGDLRGRLGDHAPGSDNTCVARAARNGLSFQFALVSGEAERKRVEKSLIREYDPRCKRTA